MATTARTSVAKPADINYLTVEYPVVRSYVFCGSSRLAACVRIVVDEEYAHIVVNKFVVFDLDSCCKRTSISAVNKYPSR